MQPTKSNPILKVISIIFFIQAIILGYYFTILCFQSDIGGILLLIILIIFALSLLILICLTAFRLWHETDDGIIGALYLSYMFFLVAFPDLSGLLRGEYTGIFSGKYGIIGLIIGMLYLMIITYLSFNYRAVIFKKNKNKQSIETK
jgi:hypothetical protein